MLKEIDQAIKSSRDNSPFKADVGASNNHEEDSESDIENMAIHRRSQIISAFTVVFNCLSDPLYALHFYLTLCRELAKVSGVVDAKLNKVLQDTLLNISSGHIEVFLYYESEAALSIVKENTGEGGG